MRLTSYGWIKIFLYSYIIKIVSRTGLLADGEEIRDHKPLQKPLEMRCWCFKLPYMVS